MYSRALKVLRSHEIPALLGGHDTAVILTLSIGGRDDDTTILEYHLRHVNSLDSVTAFLGAYLLTTLLVIKSLIIIILIIVHYNVKFHLMALLFATQLLFGFEVLRLASLRRGIHNLILIHYFVV